MALSGSVVTSSCEGRSMTLKWSASQSIANNTSTISWSLVGSGSYTGWVKCGGFYVSIGGNVVCNWSTDTRVQVSLDTTVASGSVTLSHNADGTKSFSISVQAGIYEYARNCSGSGTFTLNTIARATTPTISPASADMESTVTISMPRASSAFTHTLSYQWGSTSTVIGTDLGTSASWTIPITLANAIPSGTSSYGSVTCETYNGSTKIGSKWVRFDASVPAKYVPSVTSVGVAADNSASSVIAGWGLWVAGYTKARITAAASGIYSSTIRSFNISGGASANVTGESLDYTTGAINTSGDVTFNITATDSRGRISAAATTDAVTVYAYSAPVITEFIAHRNDSAPTKVIVKANWDISSVNSKNSATATLQYKLASASSWTTYGTISKNTEVTLSTTFSESNTYNFRLTVTDAVGNSATMDSTISTGEALLDFRTGGKGLAVGKMSESDSFEVGLPTEFHDDISVTNDSGTLVTLKQYLRDLLYPVGSIKMTTKNTNPSTYLGGTWTAWGSGKVPVGVDASDTDFKTVEKTGGEKTHTLTVDEMPAHTHATYNVFPTNTSGSAWVGAAGTSTASSYATSSAGGGGAHNNLQPYITCYMWKRTA